MVNRRIPERATQLHGTAWLGFSQGLQGTSQQKHLPHSVELRNSCPGNGTDSTLCRMSFQEMFCRVFTLCRQKVRKLARVRNWLRFFRRRGASDDFRLVFPVSEIKSLRELPTGAVNFLAGITITFTLWPA